jgi:hypothetical protein
MRHLVPENNAKFGQMIAAGVVTSGFESEPVSNFPAVDEALRLSHYAALIVDQGLPDSDAHN